MKIGDEDVNEQPPFTQLNVSGKTLVAFNEVPEAMASRWVNGLLSGMPQEY
jgi:hypothetical protein